MSDCMTFPDTVEEFMEQYKIIDTERVYTNGTEMVPIFRMKQWFENRPERRCINCGRTVNNGGWYADGRTRCPIEEHYALPKDGYCHLWEKRSVTDDDYPERREE